ncbi:MAG: PAC2 family protein [Dehalococcoidales bacterium]|nr:PAC2 family protein [Dehalococcoidales bacterium]
MSYLEGPGETRKPPELFGKTKVNHTSLVVGWTGDAGNLGGGVTSFLIDKLNGSLYYEIDPVDYFQLGGVTIEDDLVQFPESKFYSCPQHNLLILKSSPPVFEHYQFLNHILDIAEHYCHTREIYTLGSMVSLSLHTAPRQILGTYTGPEVKEDLRSYEIDSNVSYETAPGQKPTLNSFLLWMVQRRYLSGVDLWIPVPFYLMSLSDLKSQKKIIEFFNRRFKINIDLRELDEAIINQNRKINEARSIYPDIDEYLTRLESNLTLSEDENMKLIKMIEEHIKERPY